MDNTISTVVREAVGVFVNAEDLGAAVEDLRSAGFEHAELSLLAGEHTVRQKLGAIYTSINEDADDPDAPRTAFVAKESVGDAIHSVFGGMLFVGVTTAAGALVASAAALASPLLAGVASAAVAQPMRCPLADPESSLM